jgi:uncharacterized protein
VVRAVLDTNVLISAIVFGGVPRQILEAAVAGAVQLYVSEDTMAEFRDVLSRPGFGLSAHLLRATVSELGSLAEWVGPTQRISVVREDSADNRILECAIAASAEYLVSGDKHLLKLKSHSGIEVVSPQGFMAALACKG